MSTSHDLARAGGHATAGPAADPSRSGPAPGKRALTDRLPARGEPRGLDPAGAAETAAAALDVLQQRSMRSIERVPEAQRGALRLMFMSLPAVTSLDPNLALANLAVARSMLTAAFTVASRDELGRGYVELVDAELERCRRSLLVMDARDRAQRTAREESVEEGPAVEVAPRPEVRPRRKDGAVEALSTAASVAGALDGWPGVVGDAASLALKVHEASAVDRSRQTTAEQVGEAVSLGADTMKLGVSAAYQTAVATGSSAASSLGGLTRGLNVIAKGGEVMSSIGAASRARCGDERDGHLLDAALAAASAVPGLGVAIDLAKPAARTIVNGPVARTATTLVEGNMAQAFAYLERAAANLNAREAELRAAMRQARDDAAPERRTASVRVVELVAEQLHRDVQAVLGDCRVAGTTEVAVPGAYGTLRDYFAPVQAIISSAEPNAALQAAAALQGRIAGALARRTELLHAEVQRATANDTCFAKAQAETFAERGEP